MYFSWSLISWHLRIAPLKWCIGCRDREVTGVHTHKKTPHWIEGLNWIWNSITFTLARYQYYWALGFGRDSFIAPKLLVFLLFSPHCLRAPFVCKVLERCRLQKRLSSCPAAPDSAVEHSAESDTVPQTDGGPEEEEEVDEAASRSAGNHTPVKEQDLQAQVRVLHRLLRQIVVYARKHSCHDNTGRNPQNTRLTALALN